MAMNTADGRVLTYDEADFTELALESFVRRYLGVQVSWVSKCPTADAVDARSRGPIGCLCQRYNLLRICAMC